MEKGTPDNADGDAHPPPSPGDPDPKLGALLGLLMVGLMPASILVFIARFTICGISGCSGGGFGRSTDPDTTLTLLVCAGLVASAPMAIYALAHRSRKTALIAALAAILVSMAAGLIIGSDFRGCPRNVDTATCMEEGA
jgi:hypothetical protein